MNASGHILSLTIDNSGSRRYSFLCRTPRGSTPSNTQHHKHSAHSTPSSKAYAHSSTHTLTAARTRSHSSKQRSQQQHTTGRSVLRCTPAARLARGRARAPRARQRRLWRSMSPYHEPENDSRKQNSPSSSASHGQPSPGLNEAKATRPSTCSSESQPRSISASPTFSFRKAEMSCRATPSSSVVLPRAEGEASTPEISSSPSTNPPTTQQSGTPQVQPPQSGTQTPDGPEWSVDLRPDVARKIRRFGAASADFNPVFLEVVSELEKDPKAPRFEWNPSRHLRAAGFGYRGARWRLVYVVDEREKVVDVIAFERLPPWATTLFIAGRVTVVGVALRAILDVILDLKRLFWPH